MSERADRGSIQGALRAEDYRVGGSAFDRLKYDRAIGQAALQDFGMPLAGSRRRGTASSEGWDSGSGRR
ncbi:hypothetical protein [Falsiroseomonas sp. E2-1-a20]|uniref:hypothetical protein n=1 Tax=Falsiroseomonas sp. E2-1-a20 TaxID=3239300 RepID=UPI003F37A4E5